MTVITDEGAVVSGYLVEKQDEKITLSLVAQKGKRREIAVDQIDEMVESPLSTMPAGLTRSFKDRGEFLDLARFVLEINRGGTSKLRELRKKANVRR